VRQCSYFVSCSYKTHAIKPVCLNKLTEEITNQMKEYSEVVNGKQHGQSLSDFMHDASVVLGARVSQRWWICYFIYSINCNFRRGYQSCTARLANLVALNVQQIVNFIQIVIKKIIILVTIKYFIQFWLNTICLMFL
jgi:hypothetical protein